jgi:hypothetical protein
MLTEIWPGIDIAGTDSEINIPEIKRSLPSASRFFARDINLNNLARVSSFTPSTFKLQSWAQIRFTPSLLFRIDTCLLAETELPAVVSPHNSPLSLNLHPSNLPFFSFPHCPFSGCPRNVSMLMQAIHVRHAMQEDVPLLDNPCHGWWLVYVEAHRLCYIASIDDRCHTWIDTMIFINVGVQITSCMTCPVHQHPAVSESRLSLRLSIQVSG